MNPLEMAALNILDLKTTELSPAEPLDRQHRWQRWLRGWKLGVWPTARRVILSEANGWQMELLTTAIYPLTFLAAFGLGLRPYLGTVEGWPYYVFLLPGLVSYTILLESFSVGAWGLWLDRWHQGMMDEARIKPVHIRDILSGHMLGAFCVGLLKGSFVALVLAVVLGTPLFGNAVIPVKAAWLPLYLLLVMGGSVMFTSLGTMVGTLVRKPDQIAQTMTILITPMLYLGGLFFPVNSLPGWLQPVVRWLPTTALFEGGRHALLLGQLDWNSLGLVWAFALAMFLTASTLCHRALSE